MSLTDWQPMVVLGIVMYVAGVCTAAWWLED
jgi:hypothetical protein